MLLLILILSFGAFGSVEVVTTCTLVQKSNFLSKSTRVVLEQSTLSESMISSYVIKPSMSLDSNGMYLLSLSLGSDYRDSENEITGSDYYLSLVRVNRDNSQKSLAKITGNTQKLIQIQSREGMQIKTTGLPRNKELSLKYRVGKNKLIKLKCKVSGIR